MKSALPPGAMYVALRVPPEPSATVTPLARLSPTGKLMVEVVGLAVELGPRKPAPSMFWLVTVKLPVTATAPEGTPPRPLTWNVRGTQPTNLPDRPLAYRLSRSRA